MPKKYILALLAVALFLGTFIRVNSLSPYLFYPDSYVPLIVSENIKSYGSVIGQLRENGIIYPDFFGWTRPLYSVLILILNFLLGDIFLSGKVLSFVFGIIAIPLAYLYVSRALNSKVSGIFAALLLAISYNHAIWGGFIMSDTTGVFFLLIFLTELFFVIKRTSEISDLREIILGILFALAVFSRYEYSLLLLPVVYLLYSNTENIKQFFIKLINITAGSAITFAMFYFWLSPFSIQSEGINQVGSLISSLGGINLAALKEFTFYDPIIAFSFTIGVVWMFFKKEHISTLIFSLVSVLLLGLIYYQINPEMQRYYTHLIPFLILPGSYILNRILLWAANSPKRFYGSVVLIFTIFITQAYFSYLGLHKKDDGIWFKPGYEELAAKAFQTKIKADNKTIIIVSYPEPYFMFTNYSIQSISPDYPYVFISDSLNNETIYIVEDEAMRKIFPNFSGFLQNNLSSYKISELIENAPFRSAGDIFPVSNPVNIYRITLDDLKSKIKENEAYNTNPLF